MYSQTRLFNRNNNYYYRAKIPADLQDHFGKKERKFSLKTKDRAKAAALVRKFSVEEDEEFARLRSLKNKEFQTIATVDDEFIQEICNRYHYAVLSADDNLRIDRDRSEILSSYMEARPDVLPELRQILSKGDIDKVMPALGNFLMLNKIQLDCSDDDLDKLAYKFLKKMLFVHEKQITRDRGYIVETPEPLSCSLEQSASQIITWDTLLQLWVGNEFSRPAKTVKDVTHAVKQLRDFLQDKPPEKVTQTEIEDYRDYLFNNNNLKYKTVLKKVRFISSVYQVAVDKKILVNNPASKIKIPKPRFCETRLPYDGSDLEKIFNCSLFTDNDRPKGGGGEAAIWLPRLALYTGCRLEEIAQLRVKDVSCDDNIWYLKITADTTDEAQITQLKNTASIRRVPLHLNILEAGFLAYFEKIREKKHIRLFPELRPSKDGKISGNWSKWWGRYARREIGITDRNKVFHSFRHSFKDACREAELSEELSDSLTGHAATRGNATARNYGSGFSLGRLQNAIERLSFPGDF